MEMKKLIKRTGSENEVCSYEKCNCFCGGGIPHDDNDDTVDEMLND